MPRRLKNGQKRKLTQSFSIEDDLFDAFSQACYNIILKVRPDGTKQASSPSRELRNFILNFVKMHDREFYSKFVKEDIFNGEEK